MSESLVAAIVTVSLTGLLGVFGWVLLQVVRLAQIVAELDARIDGHEHRLSSLEQRPTRP